MKTKFYYFSCLIGIFLIASAYLHPDTTPQKPSVAAENEWVEKTIAKAMRKHNIPALSLGIVRDGELDFAKGFGHQDRSQQQAVDAQSFYQIGSDSKKMTAIIVKNLAKAGQLDLDKAIPEYFPKGLSEKTRQKLQPVTLRLLLQHRAGFPYRAPTNRRIDGDPMLIPFTETDVLHDLNVMELSYEPGTKFDYSNFGYAVIGYICELATQKSFGELLQRYVSEAYGMDNTTVALNEAQQTKRVLPYRKDKRKRPSQPWQMGKMVAGGGIYSNVEDVGKLMSAQLKAYRAFHESGQSESPIVLTKNLGEEKFEYGFGLMRLKDETGVFYGHGGDLDGYGSIYTFYPEQNKGLILLTSSGGKWFRNLELELRTKLFAQ
ncbi:MAG: serine hydrolase domain-containing protein [Bacteroidota bacterium]